MRLNGSRQSRNNAKRLRCELTLPEVLLWRMLKSQPIRFRKQHPAGGYTLDFYCAKARLAIEVDGETHDRGDRPGRDERRDAWLKTQGVATMRINARDVLNDLDAVTRLIEHEMQRRLGLPPPPSR